MQVKQKYRSWTRQKKDTRGKAAGAAVIWLSDCIAVAACLQSLQHSGVPGMQITDADGPSASPVFGITARHRLIQKDRPAVSHTGEGFSWLFSYPEAAPLAAIPF